MAGGVGPECFEALERQCALLRWMATPYAHALYREGALAHDGGPPSEQVEHAARNALECGVPYFWPPPFCRMLAEVAATLPTHWALEEGTLHSPAGFMWFAEPLPLPKEADREWAALVGVSWTPVIAGAPRATDDRLVVFVTTYATYADAAEPATVVPLLSFKWQWGETIARKIAALAEESRSPLDLAQTRLVGAAWAFLEQRLLTTRAERAPRALRRRLAPVHVEPPLVQVITLRRQVPRDAAGGEHAEVEWSCQWIVRGHWRDQWYPARGRHQPVWILPHVKGPEDKPLRAAASKLFAVER